MIHLYYDSKTGNVQRFIDKVTQITGWEAHKISPETEVKESGHLVTFTTNFGQVPTTTEEFLARASEKIYSVTSSGNRNWGQNYGVAADKISDAYGLPLAFKFELSGTLEDINTFIDIIKNSYYDSKRHSEELDIA